MVEWFSIFLVCYLLGSWQSAYLVGRWLKGVDIRQLGDGNAGAGNAWRTLGVPAGLGVAAFDIAKGAAAVVIARQLGRGDGAAMLGAFAVVAGHNWPLFLRFHGGRGAASALGSLMGLLPLLVFPLCLAALIPCLLTRSITVALGIVFALLPFVAWFTGAPGHLVVFTIALPVAVGMAHLFSVRRLHRRVLEASRGPAGSV
ncbi:MAG: glycerol-3-phosphate acyltransferase [Chloroflexi bacterium]|nr:glycerol-3-phosphate acyltransferase [Chloroflexota bacterium]